MIPLARSSPPARDLVSFWNEARLRADHAKSASVKPAPGIVPWRAALEDILRVGYGMQTRSRFVAGAWERVRWRTTPSAGALYPFEVMASIVGQGTYLWDIEKGHLVLCELTRDDLAGAGLVTAPGHRLEALLVVVGRPWLSMKKYRQRGYAYCHLDVGHAATNLAIYTAALGYTPILHLRFSRTFLAEHLKLYGLCREPLAVLSFASAAATADPEPAEDLEPAAATETAAGLKPLGLELPEEREMVNWESLSGILSFDSSLEPPCAADGSVPVVRSAEPPSHSLLPLPAGRPPPTKAAEWCLAILGRRSAKGFRHEPLSVGQLGEVLAALRADGLPTDFARDSSARLGVRLVARNVDGLAGVFAYSPRAHALHRIDERTEDPVPACMQQEIAGDAAALLVFHAPLCRLVARGGYSAFAELHFQAAQLGQRLYLAAARLGAVGITCVGGFDAERCAALARLDGDEETVYVILLGIPDEAAVKHDRLSVAFSHGYATPEG